MRGRIIGVHRTKVRITIHVVVVTVRILAGASTCLSIYIYISLRSKATCTITCLHLDSKALQNSDSIMWIQKHSNLPMLPKKPKSSNKTYNL